MFVSAGFELKIHSSSENNVESHPVQQHPPSPSRITCVSICNDNSYIAVLRENEKPQIFSAKDKLNVRLIHTINVSNVTIITFKRNTKKNIALGTNKGEVVIYDTKTRTVSNTIQKICKAVKSLDFTCDDQQLCGIDDGDTIFVFPEINKNDTFLKYKQSSGCNLLKCHPFIPNRATVGCKNGHIAVWDVQRGVELINFEVYQNLPISGLAVSSCGNFYIVSGKDKVKICGTDLDNGICNFDYLLQQEQQVVALDLSCDDKYLVLGLSDGVLKLYDITKELKQVYSTKVHQGPINVLVFENKPKVESNSNFSLIKNLSEQESKDLTNESQDVCVNVNSFIKNRTVSAVRREEYLDKMKKNLLKVLKNEMDSLENQLQEHCHKFQTFLDNEFETINEVIKDKWSIFNGGDMNQIIKTIFPDESKSNCT